MVLVLRALNLDLYPCVFDPTETRFGYCSFNNIV